MPAIAAARLTTRLPAIVAGAEAPASVSERKPTGTPASAATSAAITGRFALVRQLSPSGDLVEAAAGLFAALHDLDGGGFDQIWAEKADGHGLGPAINDRLFKASKK